MATEPDRNVAGGRARVDAGVVYGVVAALEGDVRFGPELLHELHLLLRPPSAVGEDFVQAIELDLVPADANAEAQAVAGENGEAGGLFCDKGGLALCEDQHAGGKAEALRDTGEEAEQYE